MEAQGVFRVKLAPAAVGNVLQHVKRDVVARLIALVYQKAGRARRILRAEVGGFEKRAQCSLRSNRMLPYKIAIARRHATEVVGPRTVLRRVYNDAPDFSRP